MSASLSALAAGALQISLGLDLTRDLSASLLSLHVASNLVNG